MADRFDLRQGRSADEVRTALGLAPHPEGGWFRETWRDQPATAGARGHATAILFLLAAHERSAWHRVDAAELWLWHAGAPLRLRVGAHRTLRLGPAILDGEQLQGLVPAHTWQSAESGGQWSLMSCVVAPAFNFDGFEIATGDDFNPSD